MEEKLPIYRIDIEDFDDSGVDFISLVDEPAIELNWLKFSKQSKIKFSVDKDKQIITGPFLIPDKKIYRNDEMGVMGEYYAYFTKETIFKIVKKFNRNNFNKNINFQHGDNFVDGVIFENFITSKEKKVDLGYEVPEGTWIGSVYIEDQKFWNNFIKTGELKGFSVEIASKLIKESFAKTYTDYPKAATENAKKALDWIDEKGRDVVKAGTETGLARANQLAKREGISKETISRMAAFERHRDNSKIDPEFEGEPWKDKGYVAWLLWGGDEGIEWAQRKLEQIKNEETNKIFNKMKSLFEDESNDNEILNKIKKLFK